MAKGNEPQLSKLNNFTSSFKSYYGEAEMPHFFIYFYNFTHSNMYVLREFFRREGISKFQFEFGKILQIHYYYMV